MRNITFEGQILSDSSDASYEYRRQLLKVFTPKQRGTLIYRDRQISCIVEEAGFSQGNIVRAPAFFISLLCPSPFEDITANETHVKATHIQALRTAANNLRNYYNLSAYAWASEIVPGRTQVRDWPFHILELRAAVQGIVDKINSFDSTSGENKAAPIDWIDIGTGRPRADVMNQLMDLILQL